MKTHDSWLEIACTENQSPAPETKNAPASDDQCICYVDRSPQRASSSPLLGNYRNCDHRSDVTVNLDSDFVLAQLTQRPFRQANFRLVDLTAQR